MRKSIWAAIILILLAIACYIFIKTKTSGPDVPKDQPIKMGSHSVVFYNSIDTLLIQYFRLADAFVNADSVQTKIIASNLSKSISVIPLEELKTDTSLKDNALNVFEADSSALASVKLFTDSISKENKLDDMRHDFGNLNENLYPFLKGIHYTGKKLYWYNCPMPFGENTSANWISITEEKMNPYLGKNHPVYKDSMLHCGDLQDTLIAK